MNTIHAIKQYVEKIVGDPKLDGMKVLLLDDSTKDIISMVYSQSEILEKDVYLVECLGVAHERMTHLKAAVFIRPNAQNLEIVRKELKDPKYGEYHFYFSNIVPNEFLTRLAEADELEVIRQVQELYADYLAVNPDLYHLNLHDTLILSTSSPAALGGSSRIMSTQEADTFNRTVDGILSCLLSLKKKPIVRYQTGSSITRRLATELSSRMQRDGLFDFRRRESVPILLVLDRKEDLVTPLLSQWTYQAMVHELLGLDLNRVDLLRQSSGGSSIPPEQQQVVLSTLTDPFFNQHKTSNIGDLGMAVKHFVDEYQAKSKTNENIESIEDMQRFVENYPAFRAESLTVSKHVTLLSELLRISSEQELMSISELEQGLACTDDHQTHFKELSAKISDLSIRPMHKVRLAILYALRYEDRRPNNIHMVRAQLKTVGIPQHTMQYIETILQLGGHGQRTGDLYNEKGGLKKYFNKFVSQGILQGVPNVYCQHTPPLMRTIETLFKGQLPESTFPTIETRMSGSAAATAGADATTSAMMKPREVIVFITGGVTFEEAEKVCEWNAKNPTQRVILGGSCIQNSTSLLKEVQGIQKKNDSTNIAVRSYFDDDDMGPHGHHRQAL